MTFTTEAMTYVYRRRDDSRYVLIDVHARRADEPVTPNMYRDTGTWTETSGGTFVWKP